MKKRRKKVNMLEGNLLENVILFALPLIASGIMQLLFNAIDMVVVGSIPAMLPWLRSAQQEH